MRADLIVTLRFALAKLDLLRRLLYVGLIPYYPQPAIRMYPHINGIGNAETERNESVY